MRTGRLAGAYLTSTGWTRVYTVPRGEKGTVDIRISCSAGNAEYYIRHVRAGNEGTITHTDDDTVSSLTEIRGGAGGASYDNRNTDVHTLGVESLDDIWVNTDTANRITVNINSQGIEYNRRNN